MGFDSHAETYQVTRQDDPVPDGCLVNDCSLREAVITANNNPGLDNIILGNEIYQLNLAGFDDFAAVGDLDIIDDLVISGEDLQATIIDANLLTDRIFDIHPGAIVEFSEVALINSDMGQLNGGAINMTNASILLIHVLISNNTANRGGGIHAISSQVEIINSFISGNNSEQEGGALFMLEGQLHIQDSQVIGNHSGYEGGGVYVGFNFINNNVPNISINNSFVIGNVAQLSGGGFSFNSNASINIEAEMSHT